YQRKVISVRLLDKRLISFDTQAYDALSHGYAITANKAEGETFSKVFVRFDPLMDPNNWLIACTRHRTDLRVYVSTEQAIDLKAIIAALGRSDYRPMVYDSYVQEQDRPY